MKISTRGRYALCMMVDICKHQDEGYVTMKDVAERQDISKKYLEQIVMQLTRGGMLVGTRGHQGGYRLVGTPGDYTVADVLHATEGSLAPVTCLDGDVNTCGRCPTCETLPVWEGLDLLMQRYLASITLQSIVDDPRGAVLAALNGSTKAKEVANIG